MTPESLVAWKAARAERNRKLDRATQALKDASVAYSAIAYTHGRYKEKTQLLDGLVRAAEDYAEAYLRG